MIELIFRLLIAHALTDFALQSDLMAMAKKRTNGRSHGIHWNYWLTQHALICAGGVYWATGSLSLGIVELFLHAIIDNYKSEGLTSPRVDQAIHIVCRIFYMLWSWVLYL